MPRLSSLAKVDDIRAKRSVPDLRAAAVTSKKGLPRSGSMTVDPDPHPLSGSGGSNVGAVKQGPTKRIATATSTHLLAPPIPRSSSSPALHLLSRSATCSSLASNSSSGSQRLWQYGSTITQWLGNSKTTTVAQDERERRQNIKDMIAVLNEGPPEANKCDSTDYRYDAVRRSKIIQELITTEEAYQRDMMLVKEIYLDAALADGSPFSKSDLKLLFSNLQSILDFEEDFIILLKSSEPIGHVFRNMMHRIDHIYCEYCKRHEDAVNRLQVLETVPEVSRFLEDCKRQMQGRTMSWDLGSLLIKPVQRVLKYPLLLREILALTPPDHPDMRHLRTATKAIQDVTDHINEIKRRKDIVERIVSHRRKTDMSVVHGINKSLTRHAQRLRQAAGMASEPTQDILFAGLKARFDEQQKKAMQLACDVQDWVRHVHDHLDNLHLMATSLETLYDSLPTTDHPFCVERTRELSKATLVFSTVVSRDLEAMVQEYVLSRIQALLKLFQNPSHVMSKRTKKLLDYDRVRDIKARGLSADKTLQQSANAYVSINAQLVEELPLFLKLTTRYFEVIVADLAKVQGRHWYQCQQEWEKLVHGHLSDAPSAILPDYTKAMDAVREQYLDRLKILDTAKYAFTVQGCSTISNTAVVHDRGRTPSLQSDDDTRSSISYGRTSRLSSYRATLNTSTAYLPQDSVFSLDASPTSEGDKNHHLFGGSQPVFECVALQDYSSQTQESLNVRQGDIIQIWLPPTSDTIDPWWYGSRLGDASLQCGWIPARCCQKMSPSKQKHSSTNKISRCS